MTGPRIVATDGAPAAIGPYSQAVVLGGFVHCSGQIGLDPTTGEMVPGGLAEQTERVLDNLEAVLVAAGSSLDRVVKCNVYVIDLGSFGVLNEAYAARFGASLPARATVEVSRLPKDALVEIDCVAAVS